MQKNLVVLYTRMPRYFFECLTYFVRSNPNYSVFCLCNKPSEDAPFSLSNEEISIEFLETLDRSVGEWVDDKSPSLIFAAGWTNSDYLSVCKRFVRQIPVIVGMDNLWNGALKQRVFCLFSRFFLKKYFNHIWVPGSKHERYARKLGFSANAIRRGLYSCESIYTLDEDEIKNSSNEYKEVLFVGRFVDYKRPRLLAETFMELIKEPEFKDWRLKMIGNGPLKNSLMQMADETKGFISVFDFQQSTDLKTSFARASVFCLPSSNEHWGVVVHEAASMGLPIIISDSCGSYPDLLEDGLNGLVFRDKDELDFKKKLRKMLSMSEADLSRMSKNSKAIAQSISVENWNKTMLGFLR